MADWHSLEGSSEEHSVFWRYIFFPKEIYHPSVSGDFHLAMLHTDCPRFWSHRMFFAGCCYGKETDSFHGVQLPQPSHPVYPTQLYEAVFLLILFFICFYLLLKKDFIHNLSLYLISYGIFRYFLEYLRGDNRGELIGLITPSQFWSLLMILLGIILIFVIKNLYQRNGK